MSKSTNLKTNNESHKIWNPVFVSVLVINILTHLCTFMMNTLSAKYADYLGATATIVGLVTGLFALTALIFKIISAPAIDTYNRKYILVGSIFILFASFVSYSLSKTIPMLIFSRLLTGAGLAFSTTGCLTIASDSLPNEKMASGIGYFSLGTAIAQAIAPTIGLKLVESIGYTYTFVSLSAFMLLTIGYAATMKMDFTRVNKFKITIKSIIAKEAMIPTVILFFLSMAFGIVNAFLVLFAEGKGINSNIGYFFTIYAVTMIFTRPFIGKLADRFGTIKVVVPSLTLFALSFVLISYSNTLPMFLVSGFVMAFGYGGCQPAILAVSMKSVPRERRGAASCTSYVGLDLGNLAGPVMAGGLIELFGYASMWRFMVIPIVIAMVIGLIYRKSIEHAGEDITNQND